MSSYFSKQQPSIQKQLNERKRLIKPIIRYYGLPVIVHSVDDIKKFKTIVLDGKLKLPKDHNSARKTPYIEELLGIDNCLYYSVGFVYFSSYKWKYNFMFDLSLLKDIVYYRNSVNFKAARAIVDYWYTKDVKYFKKFSESNTKTRKVIDKYLHKPYNGKFRRLLDFWHIEKELGRYIDQYPDKKKLVKIAKNEARKNFVLYPASRKNALKSYMSVKAPELVGKKTNNLANNPAFIGFFIKGRINRMIMRMLKHNYPNKVLFDGEKIRKISEL